MTGGHRSIGVINGDHPIGVASANQKWQWDIRGQSMEISSYLNLSIYPIPPNPGPWKFLGQFSKPWKFTPLSLYTIIYKWKFEWEHQNIIL